MSNLLITSIEVSLSQFDIPNLGLDLYGFSLIYNPGGNKTVKAYTVRINTNEGLTGEMVGGDATGYVQLRKFVESLSGMDPTKREEIYGQAKRYLRKFDKMGMGMINVPLWDLAGKIVQSFGFETPWRI
jgi:L-alanine-DL-glutamate epimerase-like enolase superfamily enzyme